MRWECPFRGGARAPCRLFDGRCEPGSYGCLLAASPYVDAGDDGPERDAPLVIEPAPWPRPPGRHTRERSKPRRRTTRTARLAAGSR
jgi:hypothetical protein